MSEWIATGPCSAPDLHWLTYIAEHSIRSGERGVIEVKASPRIWEMVCRNLNRPISIIRAEDQGILVSHVCGREVHVIASAAIQDDDVFFRVERRPTL